VAEERTSSGLRSTDDPGSGPEPGGAPAAASAADPSAGNGHLADDSALRAPGWREVLLVAVAIVAISLGAAAVTGLLPPAGQDLVFKTPLVIVVLLVGTIGLMVRLAMRRPPA